MSEMIKYKDRSITLGTCQNLYYATYADLKNNVEHFTKISGLSVEGYLNEKYGFRYRFPFPVACLKTRLNRFFTIGYSPETTKYRGSVTDFSIPVRW